jgi:hypothetical protein
MDADDRALQGWWKLPHEERVLREVLAWIAEGKTHCKCSASADGHRPLHVTALYDEGVYGFALKLEGKYHGFFFVRLLDTKVFDLVFVDWDPSKPARGALLRARGRKELEEIWLGAVQTFSEQRGLLPKERGQ